LTPLAVIPEREAVKFRRLSFKDGDYAKLAEYHKFLFVGDMVGIVAELGGEVIGAGVFNTFSKNSCFAHLFVRDPAAFHEGLLERCCMLAYVELGVGKVIVRLPESNEKIVKSAKRGGFTLLFRLPDGNDVGDDYLFFELNREDCSYLPNEFRR
jgi:hypothetical protein